MVRRSGQCSDGHTSASCVRIRITLARCSARRHLSERQPPSRGARDVPDGFKSRSTKSGRLFYALGAIDWILIYDNNNPLPFGQQSLLIEEGLTNLDSALAINPQYEDAMTYKNLLLREKARLAVDPAEKVRLTALADQWFNKALETPKANAQTRRNGPSGSLNLSGPLPPPPPPPAR